MREGLLTRKAGSTRHHHSKPRSSHVPTRGEPSLTRRLFGTSKRVPVQEIRAHTSKLVPAQGDYCTCEAVSYEQSGSYTRRWGLHKEQIPHEETCSSLSAKSRMRRRFEHERMARRR